DLVPVLAVEAVVPGGRFGAPGPPEVVVPDRDLLGGEGPVIGMQVPSGAAVRERRRIPRAREFRAGEGEEPLGNLRGAEDREVRRARRGNEPDADPDLDGTVEGGGPDVGGEADGVQSLLAQCRSGVGADRRGGSWIVEALRRKVEDRDCHARASG